jgi:hypothetical protein
VTDETPSKPRIGPTMRALADVVSAMPGGSKSQALLAVGLGPHGIGCWRPIQRIVAAGLVIVEKPRPNLHRLFATETDRQLWHLRDEVLHGDPSPERAQEIAATIERIRDAQAAAYAAVQEAAGQ